MAEHSNIVCPECGRQQASDNPFCDDCGYRIGRSDASQEIRVARRPKSHDADTDVERPAVSAALVNRSAVATAIEGVSAVPAALAARSESTEVEGLKPVPGQVPTDRPPSSGPPLSAVETAAELISPELPASLETETQGRRLVWIALWIASIAATAAFASYAAQIGSEPAAGDPTVAVPAQSRILIPAGAFKRGLNERVRSFVLSTCLKMSDDRSICDQTTLLAGEFPEERIELSSFAIDRLEVTIAEFERCVAAGKCEPIDWKDCKVFTHQGLQISLRVPKTQQAVTTAATCTSRPQAAGYCAWRDGRLPTHDEWERAARGTDGRVFPWGSIWDPTGANWGEIDVVRVPVVGKIDGFEWAAPPGQFPAGESPTTTLDMAGNVSEWVANDPAVARGGSWISTPFDLRVTARLELDPGAHRTDVGFRCAYDALSP